MQQIILGDGVGNAFLKGRQDSRQERNFDAVQGERTAKAIQDGVRAADTPEKWQVLVSQLSNRYGAEAVAPFADFNTRGQALSELESSFKERSFNALQAQRATSNRNSLSALAQRQKNADRSFELSKTNADRNFGLNTRRQNFLEKKPFTPFTDTGKINVDERRNNITPKQAEGLRAKEIGGKATSIQNKVATLVASGLTLQQAQAVAGGRFAVSVNPNTGERVLVDKGTQEIIPLSQPAQVPQIEPLPLQQPETSTNTPSNPTLSQASENVGGINATVQSFFANTPGGLGEFVMRKFPDSRDVVRNKEVFKVLQNKLIRAFSLSGRFSVKEVERITKLLPEPGVFSNPEAIRIKLGVLSNELKSAIQHDMTIARSRAPISERNAAIASAKAKQEFIDAIGNDIEIPTVSSVAEARKLPKGTRFRDPNNIVRIR